MPRTPLPHHPLVCSSPLVALPLALQIHGNSCVCKQGGRVRREPPLPLLLKAASSPLKKIYIYITNMEGEGGNPTSPAGEAGPRAADTGLPARRPGSRRPRAALSRSRGGPCAAGPGDSAPRAAILPGATRPGPAGTLGGPAAPGAAPRGRERVWGDAARHPAGPRTSKRPLGPRPAPPSGAPRPEGVHLPRPLRPACFVRGGPRGSPPPRPPGQSRGGDGGEGSERGVQQGRWLGRV